MKNSQAAAVAKLKEIIGEMRPLEADENMKFARGEIEKLLARVQDGWPLDPEDDAARDLWDLHGREIHETQPLLAKKLCDAFDLVINIERTKAQALAEIDVAIEQIDDLGQDPEESIQKVRRMLGEIQQRAQKEWPLPKYDEACDFLGVYTVRNLEDYWREVSEPVYRALAAATNR